MKTDDLRTRVNPAVDSKAANHPKFANVPHTVTDPDGQTYVVNRVSRLDTNAITGNEDISPDSDDGLWVPGTDIVTDANGKQFVVKTNG